MSQPPDLVPFGASWAWKDYEDVIYKIYFETIVQSGITFRGDPVRAQYRPETRGKGFSFWHLISEAPDKNNRNEDDRIPDLERCARIRWVAWCINNAGQDGFPWWENKRKSETHVVIWARWHDFAVVLAKRQTREGPRYYLLKTAYCLKAHRRQVFAKECDEYWAQKD